MRAMQSGKSETQSIDSNHFSFAFFSLFAFSKQKVTKISKLLRVQRNNQAMTRIDLLVEIALFFLAFTYTQASALRCLNCEIDIGGDGGGDTGRDGTTRQFLSHLSPPALFFFLSHALSLSRHPPPLFSPSHTKNQNLHPPPPLLPPPSNSPPASLPRSTSAPGQGAGRHAATCGTAPRPFALAAAPTAPSRWGDPTARAGVRGTPRTSAWKGIGARAAATLRARLGRRCCVSWIVWGRLCRREG